MPKVLGHWREQQYKVQLWQGNTRVWWSQELADCLAINHSNFDGEMYAKFLF